MKPEPLTKEKMDMEEIMKQYRYLSIRRQIDFRDGFNHAISLTESAVQWLLKEIEKDAKEIKHESSIGNKERKAYFRGYYDGEMFCMRLIKKAFEGVIEE